MTEENSQATDRQDRHVKGVIEALLFVNEKPVTLDQFKRVLETLNAAEIKQIIQNLMGEYEERQTGMKIVEIAGGYQMLSNPNYAQYIRSFYKTKHKEKLSKPALETLAIMAYKQPVTRTDVELVRGVNSDGVIAHLLSKELIKPVGRKDVPGRPFLYGTTRQFLEYFGLKSLEDLPALEEFPTLVPPAELETEGIEIEGEDPAVAPTPQEAPLQEASLQEQSSDQQPESSGSAVAVETAEKQNENT